MPDQYSNTRRAEPILSELELYSEYRNCDRWAIIVGISRYRYQGWNLRYADRDAEELYNLLLTPSGGNFKKEFIRKLTNEEATTGNITRALRTFLKKPAREDLVVIYFACHGKPDFDRPGNVYLLTHDTAPDDIAGTALPMHALGWSLKDLHAKKVIVLADTCHSAVIGGGIGSRSAVDDSIVINRYLQEVSRAGEGLALLTSAEANEVSFEDARWGGGHGVFTHYLLEGMRGAADRDGNGIVTVGELFEYVRDNVKRATEYRQHPLIGSNAYDRNLPMAITPNSSFSKTSQNHQQSQDTRRSGVGQTVEENLDLTLELALTTQEMANGAEKPVFTGKENITVKIPAGVSLSKRIRVPGKGRFEPHTQQRGDLYLIIKRFESGNSSDLPEDDLSSACGIEYKVLRDFLVSEKWREADEETESILQLLLNRREINQLPCVDLWTIDQLWGKYSDMCFGLSVQRRIWHSVGGEASQACWKGFCHQVGWMVQSEKKVGWLAQFGQNRKEMTLLEIRSELENKQFKLLPKGYLPSFIQPIAKTNFLLAQQFFSRLQACRL